LNHPIENSQAGNHLHPAAALRSSFSASLGRAFHGSRAVTRQQLQGRRRRQLQRFAWNSNRLRPLRDFFSYLEFNAGTAAGISQNAVH
jgi:hypothetical protein